MEPEFPITSFSTDSHSKKQRDSKFHPQTGANGNSSHSNHVTFGNMIQQNSNQQSSSNSSFDHIVKNIKKDRHKKGVHQMLVVYQEDKNDNGHWVNVSDLNCPELITQFLDQKKDQKEKKDTSDPTKQGQSTKKSNLRSIKEIRGMIASPTYKFIYVVEFTDSATEEYVSWKEMRKHYSKQLLKYYESHIDDDADENEQMKQDQTTNGIRSNLPSVVLSNQEPTMERNSTIQRVMSVQPRPIPSFLPELNSTERK